MSTLSFDFSRGVDVMRGTRVIAHFDGPLALEYARLEARRGRGLYVRFWAAKPAPAAG